MTPRVLTSGKGRAVELSGMEKLLDLERVEGVPTRSTSVLELLGLRTIIR